jgi:hypothetical protein
LISTSGARVRALVVVGRLREGHEHGGLAGHGQLRAGGGAAARDHEVRLREACLHVVEERQHLGLAPGGRVGGSHLLAHGLAGLMDDAQAGLRGQARQRGHHGAVEDARALAASEHEQRVRLAVLLAGQAGEPAAHRVARDHPLGAERARGLLVRAGAAAHERPQHAVGEAGLRVGLQDHGRHPQQRGEQDHRPPGISPHAQDRARTMPAHEGRRLPERAWQREEALDGFDG